MHMENGAEPARYCYLGEVFASRTTATSRPEHPRDNEYLQAGFELFARDADADAEVFALFHSILAPLGLRAAMGDMDLLMDAVRALPLSARRAALLHHIWRPGALPGCWRVLPPRLSRAISRPPPRHGPGCSPPKCRPASTARPTPPRRRFRPQWVARLDRLFAVQAPAPEALRQLRALLPKSRYRRGGGAADRNLALLADRGIDVGGIHFDASHGRHTMEYYDGMTFSSARMTGRTGPRRLGGRYDALAAVLGQARGRAIPAVGGIIRPGLVHELGGLTQEERP